MNRIGVWESPRPQQSRSTILESSQKDIVNKGVGLCRSNCDSGGETWEGLWTRDEVKSTHPLL
jgi:hypothetical protein